MAEVAGLIGAWDGRRRRGTFDGTRVGKPATQQVGNLRYVPIRICRLSCRLGYNGTERGLAIPVFGIVWQSLVNEREKSRWFARVRFICCYAETRQFYRPSGPGRQSFPMRVP